MSFAADELADRVRDHLGHRPGITERKMFGDRAFMLHGNMVVAIMSDGALLARVGKDGYDAALSEPGASAMTMGTRTMGGFVSVDGDVLEDDDTLAQWLDRCRAFAASLPSK